MTNSTLITQDATIMTSTKPGPQVVLPVGSKPPMASCSPGHPEVPGKLHDADIEEILDDVRAWSGHSQSAQTRGVKRLLSFLQHLPGTTWPERWLELETRSAGQDWRTLMNRDDDRQQHRMYLTAGLGALLVLDVIRPSYGWIHGRRFDIHRAVSLFRDRKGTEAFVSELDKNHLTLDMSRLTVNTVAQMQEHTGKYIRQLTIEDFLEVIDVKLRMKNSFKGIQAAWRAFHRLGWLPADRPTAPIHRAPKLTAEGMIDFYQVPEPWRQPLIEYLKTRSTSLDYSTIRNLAARLAGTFWTDILTHYPTIQGFQLTRRMAEDWKMRVWTASGGDLHSQYWQTMFTVRSFYNDMNSWALHDAYWVEWTAPCPVTRADIRGYDKHRRRQIASMQQRTRQIAPLLPRLVSWAEQNVRQTKATLDEVAQLTPGDQYELDGHQWTVVHITPRSPIRLRRQGEEGQIQRNPAQEEESGFWTWAVIETLRHTGIRIEELVELTHLAIQPYKDQKTGETIPLLHIVPSKTDTERLIVAGPELVHVLAQVIKRIRNLDEAVPLTERWDSYEHHLSPPLPHLFAKPFQKELRAMSTGTLRNILTAAAKAAGLTINGDPVIFSAHDFRRIFATDALSSGLPPHIVQILMGHKSLGTTQGYAAVYPQDVIRHHRTHIARRRQARPSEEYREPSAAEWDQFESHFAKRKVSMGSCGRAYGTDCHHEHACLRCSLLRPDPEQLPRLDEIIDNLKERIDEAQTQGWLGEVDGLQISLSGAEAKRSQIDRLISNTSEPVSLGIPRIP